MNILRLIGTALVVALAVGLVLSAVRQRRTAAASSARPADLSVRFLGWTNDPGQGTYPALAVAGNGTGRHVLVAFSNASPVQVIGFGITALEYSTPEGFVAGPRTYPQSALGMTWRPGFAMRYAIPTPVWLPVQRPCRMRLWVERERRGWVAWVHRTLGREVFGPGERHEVVVDFEPLPVPP